MDRHVSLIWHSEPTIRLDRYALDKLTSLSIKALSDIAYNSSLATLLCEYIEQTCVWIQQQAQDISDRLNQ